MAKKPKSDCTCSEKWRQKSEKVNDHFDACPIHQRAAAVARCEGFTAGMACQLAADHKGYHTNNGFVWGYK